MMLKNIPQQVANKKHGTTEMQAKAINFNNKAIKDRKSHWRWIIKTYFLGAEY